MVNNLHAELKATAGFSLIELLVVVAIIAILSAIALPLYRGYVTTAAEGVLMHNISTIEIFQEDLRLRTGSYATDIAAVRALGWTPDSDGITYAMTGSTSAYQVTATDDAGVSVCLAFPGKTACP